MATTDTTIATRAALAVRGLTRDFGTFRAFGPIDLEVAPEERIALRGPNGSGKTTFLRCLTGTLTPTAGEALVGGDPAGTLPARRRVGASLSVERSFYLRLSGWANLLFFARLRQDSESAARGQVEALVAELELEDIVRAPAGQLLDGHAAAGWPSPAPCSGSRSCCCSTSRPDRSTSTRSTACGPRWPTGPPWPCSWRPTAARTWTAVAASWTSG